MSSSLMTGAAQDLQKSEDEPVSADKGKHDETCLIQALRAPCQTTRATSTTNAPTATTTTMTTTMTTTTTTTSTILETAFTAGFNARGQLGVPDNSGTIVPNPTPLQVTSLGSGVKMVAGGASHSIFLMENGTVFTAGFNRYGQLGVSHNSGTSTPNPKPLQVTSLGSGVKMVAGGASHSIFLMENGSVFTAGYNYQGQLGVSKNLRTSIPNPTPLQVTSLGSSVEMAAGGGLHSLFLMENGTAFAAGYNYRGQLGVSDNSGTTVANPTPLQVTSLGSGVKMVAGGNDHSLFVMENGSAFAVFTAGFNRYGQLGVSHNSGTSTPNPKPLQVSRGVRQLWNGG
eukprot:TRINITY_DN38992_c0_g1_i2.p1 TRINITY_DN38992_c0_g1~~TRINITY_DN38992_c0_g1_i2.p1  ORF type:complete len:373 (+),score=53.04 TRINITY_DN38992_c0_g1_i2:94-1119(+)